MNTAQIAPLAGPGPLGTLLNWRRAWLEIDKNPSALAFSSTTAGRLLVYAAFVAVLWLGNQVSGLATALVALTVAACVLAPHRKLMMISVSGIVYFCLRPFRTQQQIEFSDNVLRAEFALAELSAFPVHAPIAVAFLLLCFACVRFVRHHPASLPSRRPLLCQLLVLCALMVAASAMPANTTAYALTWSMAVMMAASFFFLAYLLVEARTRQDVPDALRLGFMRPFWGGPSIPFKGPSYLQRFEARQPEELAALQLRALKLIVWAALLAGLCRLLESGAYDVAGMPTLQEAISANAEGDRSGRAMAWAILIKTFLLNLLSLAALVHTLVAIIRMCGYGIPRGMARPLSARSIAEFWNRYLFYFKELLVDFFFYPAFVRFFKRWPKLRIAFATFSAAFVGNVLFSILSQAHLFAEAGFWPTLRVFDSYAVYALALSLALIASQLRAAKPRPEHGFLRYDVLPRLNVIGFFCVAQIFSDESGQTSLAERSVFLAYLVGA